MNDDQKLVLAACSLRSEKSITNLSNGNTSRNVCCLQHSSFIFNSSHVQYRASLEGLRCA